MDISQKILSDTVIWSKYAKYIPELRRRESWEEICKRNMAMHIQKYPQLKDEIKQVYQTYVFTKKVLPSMRSLQFGGRPVELANNRLFNCAYVTVDNPASFWETIFLLLGGSGVGLSVQTQHINKLPIVQGPTEKTRRYLIGDSIEGWADSVRMLIRAYFEGRSDPVFDFRDIRKKGATLITSGGKAPGPDPLRICLDQIRKVLNDAIGRQLKPIEAFDILCHIADAVLAGGIRRAALITLFSKDDMDMMSAKSGAWWELNPQRGRSNNSVVLKRGEVTKEEFDVIWQKVRDSGCGEPGFFWTNDLDIGTNPCCFVGDTIVDTTEGSVTIKDIVDQIETKQFVAKCYDVETGEYAERKIINGMLTHNNTQVITLEIERSDGVVVKVTCTPDHKFFTKNRGWVEASQLTSEDNVVANQVEFATLKSITFETKTQDVYDIEVEDMHNFFVSGILAKNCEISLKNMQFCNLTEVNVSDVVDQQDLNDRVQAGSFLGTIQAGYTDFHYLRPQWKENTEKDALLGVSMTGIASGGVLNLNLIEAANIAKEENSRVAKIIGINEAARVTCVKPSGTSSLTVGSSSGIHAWHNDYYIRRIRVGKNESLYHYMINNFPDLIEDCVFKPHLEAVMSFPQKAPENAILRTESAMHLLERVKKFNQEWVHGGYREGANHHNVSCTISIKDEDWGSVGEWMWNNRKYYTGISVLPFSDHTYQQAPFENCTKEQYEQMISQLHSIDITQIIEEQDNTSLTEQVACSGAGCEI